MQHQNVKSLSIEVLIRLWFRCLWQKYSNGGINCGRSRRCDLLDCYLDFTPLPRLPGSLDDYTNELETEILKRSIYSGEREVVWRTEIPRYTKDEIALSGLGALLALEWSVDEETAFENGYMTERMRMKEVLDRTNYMVVQVKDVLIVSEALLQRKRIIRFKENGRDFPRLFEDE